LKFKSTEQNEFGSESETGSIIGREAIFYSWYFTNECFNESTGFKTVHHEQQAAIVKQSNEQAQSS
jgi:hypothetical protein